jgi:uncharacterized membrane protein
MALRFHALDRQSLWDDEMSTIKTISTPSSEFVHRFATYETHPPIYFLQLKLWRALGMRSLVKLRANSAFWGSLSLILIYIVGRLYGGDALGLLVMTFLALAPLHIAYSQEMRPYALAMTIGLAALWALERRAWVGLSALWTALLYTHYWGAFVVLAQSLYAFYRSASWPEKKTVLMTTGVAGFCFLFWLPVLGSQFGVIDRLVFWASPFSFVSLGKVFLAYSGFLFNMASWTFYLPTRLGVLLLLGIPWGVALAWGCRQGPRGAQWWLGVGLGVPWLLSLWKPSIFLWYRYPVLMLPAFILLVAAGFLAITSMRWRVFLVLIVLGTQGWGIWVYFHQWQKANPKSVVQYIHWLRRPNSIVVRPSYFSDLFNFYDQGSSVTIDEHVFDAPEKRAALKGKTIILVSFDVPSDPVADAFLQEFTAVSARYFPGLAHLGITVYELR